MRLPPEGLADDIPFVRVLVDLEPRVDLEELGREMTARGWGRRERRRHVVERLRRTAEDGRASLVPLLEELEARRLVRSWRGFSVVDRLLVEAAPEALRELARRPEVVAIVPEEEGERPAWMSAGAAPEEATSSWALDAIGADEAWRRGLSGRGVVVGIIDSGASDLHVELAGGLRAWYDPAGGRPRPADTALGHGTGVLSVAVGRNVGQRLGIAPGAEWTACAALPRGRYNNVLMTECADWMLNVAQPDVLINAWSLPGDGCDDSLRAIVDAWRAAEILPVFAAGNATDGAAGDRSPANYTDLYPGDGVSLSVGGLAEDGSAFGATGPNRCDPAASYPRLVAPAVDLTAALPLTRTTYVHAQGTSYAAGLVAGVAALLLEHRPGSLVSELEAALVAGTVDLGPPGPDPRFGHGRVDLPRALVALERLVAERDAAKTSTLLRP